MNRLILALCVGVRSFGFVAGNSSAKRLCGGKSAGVQRDGVAQMHQASFQPGAPAQNSSAFLAAAVSFDEAWNLANICGWQLP